MAVIVAQVSLHLLASHSGDGHPVPRNACHVPARRNGAPGEVPMASPGSGGSEPHCSLPPRGEAHQGTKLSTPTTPCPCSSIQQPYERPVSLLSDAPEHFPLASTQSRFRKQAPIPCGYTLCRRRCWLPRYVSQLLPCVCRSLPAFGPCNFPSAFRHLLQSALDNHPLLLFAVWSWLLRRLESC